VTDDNPPSQKHNGWHCCDLQPQGPRSRAFYSSRNGLLHAWITYYTELPTKVLITPHHLEKRYYGPPPIAITENHLTRLYVQSSVSSPLHHFLYRRLSVLICLQALVSFSSCFCTSFSAAPLRIASLTLLSNVE